VISFIAVHSQSAAAYKISSKSNNFSLKYGDFKMAIVRHFEFSKFENWWHSTVIVVVLHLGFKSFEFDGVIFIVVLICLRYYFH